METTRQEIQLEDLFISFNELYENSLKIQDYKLSLLLKEEMRKLVSNSGPIFRINQNFDFDFYEV